MAQWLTASKEHEAVGTTNPEFVLSLRVTAHCQVVYFS